MPIPEFNESGYLPPGQHIATWREFLERFGTNPQRLRLATGLAAALRKLAIVGCGRAIIGGSFVTVKEVPNDFDAYFDDFGLDFEAIDPIFIDRDRIERQQEVFGGELQFTFGYDRFLQTDREGNPRGVIELNPQDLINN